MKPFNESKAKEFEFKIGYSGTHGDVIVECLEMLPNDFDSFERIKDDCVAYGEATGHAHKLFGDDFDLRKGTDGLPYLRLVTPVMLRHQEHDPVVLPPGIYRFPIQKEYDHSQDEERLVVD